ncbi:MAG: TetR/AcrR family transcriptional regulator [Subtercola sp.]|nr:TetR/AcrR family transcriptional regulator [Subtercola sp.]
MSATDFARARSTDAKLQREQSILTAARSLGIERGIREVTLTDIAAAIGMHKSALLRYFETREQIYLTLTALEWQDWGPALCNALNALAPVTTQKAADTLAQTLVARPFFCDLLAHVPLNLERHVSLDAVREFKLVTHSEVDKIIGTLRTLFPGLSRPQALDVVATATSMAGAQWQMANPGEETAALYRSDPRLAHAIVEVGPRLSRVLGALLTGFLQTAN